MAIGREANDLDAQQRTRGEVKRPARFVIYELLKLSLPLGRRAIGKVDQRNFDFCAGLNALGMSVRADAGEKNRMATQNLADGGAEDLCVESADEIEAKGLVVGNGRIGRHLRREPNFGLRFGKRKFRFERILSDSDGRERFEGFRLNAMAVRWRMRFAR